MPGASWPHTAVVAAVADDKEVAVPQEDLAGPADVIGEAAPAGVGGVMAGLFQRGGAATHRDAFALGERGAILHHLDQAAIIPHVAESEARKAPFEVPPARPRPCPCPALAPCSALCQDPCPEGVLNAPSNSSDS